MKFDHAGQNEQVIALHTKHGQTELIVSCAADIEPEHVDWLWPGRLARGKHTCIAGEPGTGKSQLSLDIVATITRGREWPCGEGQAPAGEAIIFSAEDGAADTILPRLLAAGADLAKVHLAAGVREKVGNRRTINLQSDLQLIEGKLESLKNVALIVVDPVSSYLGKTDSHKNSDVRSVLEPLTEMAERHGVAILSITHFTKAGGNVSTKALHRFMGSIAFTGAPRAAFAVVEDAKVAGRRLLLSVKNNLAPPPQGLAFRFEQLVVDSKKDDIIGSHIVWDKEPVNIGADEALAADSAGRAGSTKGEEAEDWLRTLLSSGPLQTNKIQDGAAAIGIQWTTVRRAKDRLNLLARRESAGNGGAGHWTWRLPETARCSEVSQDAPIENASTLRPIEHLALETLGEAATPLAKTAGDSDHDRDKIETQAGGSDMPDLPMFLDRRRSQSK